MQITRLLATTALLALATTTAFAQRYSPDAPSDFTWSGFYAGLNAGGAFNGTTRFDRTTGALANNTQALTLGLRPTVQTTRFSGFTGGGQIGYNFDLGDFDMMLSSWNGARIVTGIEADAAYTDLDQTDTLSNTTTFGPLDTPTTTNYTRVNQYHSQLDYLGTVRGRLGIAFGETLFYGTGGLAYGNVKRSVTFYGPNAPTTPFFAGGDDRMRTGYSYGGGAEFALPTYLGALNFFHSSAVTLKAEYIHYNLGNDTLSLPGVNGGATIGGYTARVNTSGDLVRAGINYKF